MNEYLAQFLPLVPDCDPTGPVESTGCNAGDFIQLVVNIINFMIDLSLVLAVILILWGGFLMITSGGSVGTSQSPGQLMRAKKTITAAVVGIVIVLASVLIVNTFLEFFTNCEVDFSNPTNIGAISC